MPANLKYGYQVPISGDNQDFVYSWIPIFIRRIVSHKHDGIDSAVLSPHKIELAQDEWVDPISVDGLYTQEKSLPVGETFDGVVFSTKVAGETCLMAISKVLNDANKFLVSSNQKGGSRCLSGVTMEKKFQEFKSEDFSGGITDNYIGANPKTARKIENLLITDNRKLVSREGSYYIDNLESVSVYNSFDFIEGRWAVFQTEDSFYTISGDEHKLTSKINPPFSDVNAFPVPVSSQASGTKWNNHLLVCDQEQKNPPVKIYRDERGVYKVTTAGVASS